MNKEGNTPSSTPKTRTVSAHFAIPYQQNGSVSYGDESWPIIDGVVKCPLEVAEGTGWMPASDAQAAAYDKAVEAASKPPKKTKAELDAEKKAEEEAEADAKNK